MQEMLVKPASCQEVHCRSSVTIACHQIHHYFLLDVVLWQARRVGQPPSTAERPISFAT